MAVEVVLFINLVGVWFGIVCVLSGNNALEVLNCFTVYNVANKLLMLSFIIISSKVVFRCMRKEMKLGFLDKDGTLAFFFL